MTDKSAEQLSVLVDDEFEEWELEFAVRRLAGDPVLKTRWEAYHLISDALRNNFPDAIDPRFADRISALLAVEDALPASAKPAVSSWYKPVAGLAVAASVGVLAVALWSLRPDELRQPVALPWQPIPPFPLLPRYHRWLKPTLLSNPATSSTATWLITTNMRP